MEQAVGEHVVVGYDDGRGKKIKDYEGKNKLHVLKRERKKTGRWKERERERERG